MPCSAKTPLGDAEGGGEYFFWGGWGKCRWHTVPGCALFDHAWALCIYTHTLTHTHIYRHILVSWGWIFSPSSKWRQLCIFLTALTSSASTFGEVEYIYRCLPKSYKDIQKSGALLICEQQNHLATSCFAVFSRLLQRNMHTHTYLCSYALTNIKFSMPWIGCVSVSECGQWTCILLHVNEAENVYWSSKGQNLRLMLPRSICCVF